MKLAIPLKPLHPCNNIIPQFPTTSNLSFTCCRAALAPPPQLPLSSSEDNRAAIRRLEGLLDPVKYDTVLPPVPTPRKLGKRWMEYQGVANWDGLLDPLDDKLRNEILRYGQFVDATYKSFDFDPSSPSYGKCCFPKNTLLDKCGLPGSGYRITKNLRVTSGITAPGWLEKAPTWVSTRTSWIGYVAVCHDRAEIARLGRRDVVIAFRGTATCFEWLENLRAGLAPFPDDSGSGQPDPNIPMVESGFLSLYTSSTSAHQSLRDMLREEIHRLLQSYGDEPLSLTLTGHSLGAALAILAACDIKSTFCRRAPHVTVLSFGGPRVGNRSFRQLVERAGTKVLRIVNSDDLITKMPGFVLDDMARPNVQLAGMPRWIRERVEFTQWVYAEVGKELRLRSKNSLQLSALNIATCHDLRTYLHLVKGFVSSTCPCRSTPHE